MFDEQRRRPRHGSGRPATGKTLVATLLVTGLASPVAGAEPAAVPASRVGNRFPSERSVYRDARTRREVVRVTSSSAEDVKIYQTHPSWTADGKWIVFHSDRTGTPQLYAVDEAKGAIVQLTDELALEAGHVCLSRRRPELLTVVGDSVVRIDLRELLDLERSDPPRPQYRQVVGRLPAGTALSGTMSWDAAERDLYLGLAYPERPPSGRWEIAALDLSSGRVRTVTRLTFRVGHVQASPSLSGHLLYCHETGGDAEQRMWFVRADGTGNRPLYRETYGEWVTHEVWWGGDRALFTVWPKDEAMRRKPHGLVSVPIDGEHGVFFHSRFPYWHVTAAAGSRHGVADTFDGEIFRVDLDSGERFLLTGGHRTGRQGAHPHPTLSPDGRRVLFNSNAGGHADLYLVVLSEEEISPRSGQASIRTRKYRRGTQEAARRWQAELRAKLFGLLKLDDLDGKSLPLAPKIVSTEDKGTYVIREVEISSTPARRIRALVTVPRPADGKHPAVVCIHGHGGNRRVVHDASSIYKGFAASLAAGGMVTIAADVGQHDVREDGRTLMGERLWDLQRCVDYLETLPEVERSKIGCAGLSLGGEMAMWLGAMDPRVAVTVSSGFLTTMDQMEINHCLCWKFEGLRELADFADIYSLNAPRALQCQNGLRENVTQFWVPLARQALREIQRIYQDFDQPQKVELDVHEGGHEIDLPALTSFLEKHLR